MNLSMKHQISAERLRKIYHYDPETGHWTHLIPRQCVKAGTRAGSERHKVGYTSLSADGRGYLAHRLAWLWVTGDWPAEQIDHVNGNRGDNRWCNLRLATNGLNKANSCLPRNNTAGFKGIHRTHRGKPWRARITVNGERISLGSFDTKEEAAMAYAVAATRYFGEFARTN